jgi:hypothetical protein
MMIIAIAEYPVDICIKSFMTLKGISGLKVQKLLIV